MRQDKIHTKTAFTMAELLISLGIIALLSLIALYGLSKATPRVDKLKFKTANLSFKNAIDSMLNNSTYYSEEDGFTDISDVKLDDMYAEDSVEYNGIMKFRNLLLHELGVSMLNTSFDCKILTTSTHPQTSHLCYRADNGVIWGIPDTDFKKTGVVKITNKNGFTSKYTPVTVYVSSDYYKTDDDFKQYAIIYGVRRDGDITLIHTIKDCDNKDNKKFAQCDIADMFASLKVNK